MGLIRERDPDDHLPTPVKVEVVDELPAEPDEPEYALLCQFLAYMRSSRIAVGGELEITLAIPFEFKYDAMPLTDLRGLNFHVAIYRPVEVSRTPVSEAMGEEGDNPAPFDPLSQILGR